MCGFCFMLILLLQVQFHFALKLSSEAATQNIREYINVCNKDGQSGGPNSVIFIQQTAGKFSELSLPVQYYTSSYEVKFKLGVNPEFRSALPRNRFRGHYALHIFKVTAENSRSVLMLSSKIILFGAPHRDHFIFVGKFSTLAQIFSTETVFNLKFRVGLCSDTNEMIYEPEIYTGSAFETTQRLRHRSRTYINLRGRHLKVAAAPIPPYITFENGEINGGAHYLMLEHYGRKFNFSMEVDFKTVDGTGIFRKGLWTGMTGAVYYRVHDMSIMMGGTVERYGVIDFISFQDDVVFFITRMPNAHIKWQAIVYPYTPSAWVLIVLSFLAVCGTLYVKLIAVKWKKSVFLAIIIPFQISLDQGFDIAIPGTIKRITALWMFFVIVISTGYRSDLVSYFSFPEPEIIPRDFESLDKRADYKVIFNYHAGTAFQYFDSATQGVKWRIRQRFELQPNTAACGISAAVDLHTVCVCWGLVIRPIISGNLSLLGASKPLMILSKPAVTFPIGFAFPKNSIYTDTFEMITGFHRDTGMVQRWNQEVYRNYSEVGKRWMMTQRDSDVFQSLNSKWIESHTKVKKFKLSNLTAIFVVLIISLAVATVAFAAELICFFGKARRSIIPKQWPFNTATNVSFNYCLYSKIVHWCSQHKSIRLITHIHRSLD